MAVLPGGQKNWPCSNEVTVVLRWPSEAGRSTLLGLVRLPNQATQLILKSFICIQQQLYDVL